MSVRVAVVVAGRGELAFAPFHGEPLLAHAVRSARAVGGREVALVVDERSRAATRDVAGPLATLSVEEWWASRSASAELVHDVMCPLVPPDLLRAVARRAAGEQAVAAFRPVTDTVKIVRDRRIEGTVDRDRLGIVVSPVLVPRSVGSDEPPPPVSLARLVAWLRERTTVELVAAPPLARRVDDLAGVALLECLEELERRHGAPAGQASPRS